MQTLMLMYTAFLGHTFLVTGSQKIIWHSYTVKCLLLLLVYISTVDLLFESEWLKETFVLHLSTGIAASIFFPTSYLFVQGLYKQPVIYPKKLVHLLPLLTYAAFSIVYYQIQEANPSASLFFYRVFEYGLAIVYSVPLLIQFSSRADGNSLQVKNSATITIAADHERVGFTRNQHLKKEITLKTRQTIHNDDSADYTKEQIRIMKTTIEGAMVYSAPYLKQKFSLADLSGLTNISIHRLSAFINSYYNMNYSDFVNMYRVEHFKRKIIVEGAWQFLTLQAIAEESGFGNRNTFTAAFKKFTNSTPIEFLKQQKVQKLKAV